MQIVIWVKEWVQSTAGELDMKVLETAPRLRVETLSLALTTCLFLLDLELLKEYMV